jgi:hypothetical protein
MKNLFLMFVAALISTWAWEGFAQEQSASKEELQEVKDALQGVSESAAEYRGYVDALRKIKISGYIQAQWRYTDVTLPVVGAPYEIGRFSGGTFPGNVKNLFTIRRGRIKVNYDNVLTQFVLQIDVVQTGFTTKDVYVMLIDPWTRSFGFQMGVFDRPFGYEISYSSSSRESPERSRLFQTLFPGERELGAKLFFAPQVGPLSMFRADVGVFNGSGPTFNEFDNYKDIIGHLALQLPFEDAGMELDVGVSGYFGEVRNNTRYLYTMGTLSNGQKGFVADSTPTNLSDGVSRTYFGADAQLYVDVPGIGGGILRGEYIFGKQPGTNGSPATNQTVSPAPQIVGPIYQRNFTGWYLSYIQNIGKQEQLILKYDVYDPNSDVSASDFLPTNTNGATLPSNTIGVTGLTATDIKFSTLGLGFIHHWDENVKFVLYYEIVTNEELTGVTSSSSAPFLFPYSTDVKDNVFTFRVQYRF